jgi:hypothetical protein
MDRIGSIMREQHFNNMIDIFEHSPFKTKLNLLRLNKDIRQLLNDHYGSEKLHSLLEKEYTHYKKMKQKILIMLYDGKTEKDYEMIMEKMEENGIGLDSIKIANEFTLFMISCISGYKTLVSKLIQKGVNVNQVDNMGMTALMYVCGGSVGPRTHKRNVTIARMLLDAGADPRIKNNWNKTAFDYANVPGLPEDLRERLDV